jgi:acetyl-CoA carboxylase/biotin carboxylase 1
MDELEAEMARFVETLPLDDQDPLLDLLQPVDSIVKKFKGGNFTRIVLDDILQQFHRIETLFETGSFNRVMLQLREEHMDNLQVVMSVARAVTKPKHRHTLVNHILDTVSKDTSSDAISFYTPTITKLTQLSKSTHIAIKAREILISFQLPTLTQRRETILSVFSKAHKKSPDGAFVYLDFSQLNKLISSRYSLLDIVPEVFFFPELHLRAIALYAYVMRTTSAYQISSFEHHYLDGTVAFSWDFHTLDQSIVTSVVSKKRRGVLFMSDDLESVVEYVKNLAPRIDIGTDDSRGWYATVALKTSPELESDENAARVLQDFVTRYEEYLKEHDLKRLTFLIQRTNFHSRYFTFKASLGYKEDPVIRHIEPFMSDRLELSRLANFEITPMEIVTRGLRMYHAIGKENPSDKRFFVRGIIHPSQVSTFSDFFITEASRITNDILDTLELLMATHPNTDCNHVLLHFLPVFHLTKDQVHHYLEKLLRNHLPRFARLRITQVEICLVGSAEKQVIPYRLVVDLKSQYVLDIHWYEQHKDAQSVLRLRGEGPLAGELVYRLHEPRQAIQPKRYQAHLLGTVYVYDFPALFQEALKQYWSQSNRNAPEVLLEYTELVLNSKGELEESRRPSGMNTCGMVAFRMKIWTPEFPEGREMIVISNDITFQMGSFGPTEDIVFLKASQLARKLGLPRIYVSANSGARIGLADEVLNKFKIAWIDDDAPAKGFDYLYLTKEDYQIVNSDASRPSVEADPILVNGEERYKLSAIIGQKDGLGVECLHGSGKIAGETSQAYQEIFTITLVTCRSVGIGAYLNRLGQRVIQVEYAPIILTGAGALNKVLGRQVYSSNLQLGGTRIMYHNGVSHQTAENDLQGVMAILKWLSYVPIKKDAPLPIVKSNDVIDRTVDVPITKGLYDPRELLQGCMKDGAWKSGFFDRGSFTETLAGWAKGVVVGRARLGGIPCGVIAVETRSTDTVLWADPAVETSQEEIIKEAGQVWYPNSSFKTAQAIRDFNYGEQLPLFVFANWRGFSGGQSDMYKEVLKFGAQIVDALREYKQPIFIYIIGELRGGSWYFLFM